MSHDTPIIEEEPVPKLPKPRVQDDMENVILISSEEPAIAARCVEAFGPTAGWKNGTIYTYGNTIYCKSPLSTEKMVHESIHVDQQKKMGVEPWWDKYFTDVEFRLEQEVEAYKAEADYIRKYTKDRNLKARLIHQICATLSSPMYGNICTFSQAKEYVK